MKPKQTYNLMRWIGVIGMRWVGVIGIAGIVALTLGGFPVPAAGLTVLVIIIDVLLVLRHEKTISSVWRGLVPKKGDYAITFLMAVYLLAFPQRLVDPERLHLFMYCVSVWMIGHIFGNW